MKDDAVSTEPLRARHASEEEVRPETPFERQESITGYLIRRQRLRRERFLRRSAAFSLRKELARNLFLAGCLLVDVLVAPDALFLFPGAYGWIGAGIGVVVALYIESLVYKTLFALPDSGESRPTNP